MAQSIQIVNVDDAIIERYKATGFNHRHIYLVGLEAVEAEKKLYDKGMQDRAGTDE